MTDTTNAREQIAKMEAELHAARERAEKLEAEHAAKKEELLKQLRDADLADVIAKCKLHGFSATDLRGALKVKGGGRKPAARKSATTRRKPAAKRSKAS
jgi:hypothetical protein